ncbi:helix-turn-helix domain-containing protein [Pseudophaeobacter sp.]|uniref:GlxA family transcriptional regulator n=1 Tax=Pseudophaeobacter sp. TaxID=1971739 RepID=UPI00329A60DD
MSQEVRVTILVADGFVPTELALAQDILRIATRVGRGLTFTCQVCSMNGEDFVEGLGGLLARTEGFSVDETFLPDHLIVLGGKGACSGFSQLRARLRWFERMGRDVLLLSDAASEWKQLYPDDALVTTHWEIQQRARDAGHGLDGALPLFSQASRITTAAGMASTADVVLNRIVAPKSLQLAQAVGQVLLLHGIREGDTSQPCSVNDVGALRLPGLEPVVAAMEQNMDTPLKTTELAEMVGLSVRQLERKFQSIVGQSPAAFYRSLRLHRARNLIEHTALPLCEVALACGLGTTSNFSRRYALEFGVSPTRRRAQLSATASQEKPTTHTQGIQNAPISLPTRPSRPSVYATRTDEAVVGGARR